MKKKTYDPKREELKIQKLESRLENLKSLNGKSYKFWAITIMRFDLGVEFTKDDYNKLGQIVRTFLPTVEVQRF